MSLPEYKYQCIDKSIITPPFKKYVVKPLFRYVPYSIPANIITIISNICLYVALFLTYQFTSNLYIFIINALLIFLYAIGDHLDGMQAKKTQTSSPLGEFIDHYLDVFNNGILSMILILSFKITNPFVICGLFLTSYIAHAGVIYEEYKTKILYFEKFGSLEAVFMVGGILILGTSKTIYLFLINKLFLNLNLLELLLIFSFIGTISTLLNINKRIVKFSNKFKEYLIFSISITFFIFIKGDLNFAFLFFTFYNAYYIGTLMRAHLLGKDEKHPDFISIILLFLSLINVVPNSFVLLFLDCMIIYLVISTFIPLKRFWVWKNPIPK